MTEKDSIEKKLEQLSKAIGSCDSLTENVMGRIEAENIETIKHKL